MRSSNLIGKENRLIYRNLSDFNDQTRYNSRTAELNADQQAAQYQAQLSLNQSTGQRTSDPNFQTAAKVPVSQGLQDARTVYNTGGSTTYSQTPGTYAGTTGTVKPTLQFGQQVTDAMGSFQAPTLQGSNNSNPTPGQEPSPSTSTGGMKDPTFYGQWGNEADMAAYEQRKTELLKQQQLKQQMDQADATKNTASSAASTAATQQNNAGSTQNDQMAKFEPMLAGLPPEDAAALRASLQSAFSSSDTQTGLAQKSYNAEIKAADQSMNAYDKVLSQQRQDSTDLYKASQGFLDDAQKRREEAIAKANENAQEQLKWQENKAVRQQKAANDKRLNQLVLGQAIGGGFGSSNWTAEVVDAEWEGEQAVIDLQKEFGFKRADVDIAFTEQLNGIYEFYGSQKLDALKTYKAELQNNSNLRFQAADKTETRKADARTKLNDTLATIAKDQAAEIKDATKEVRNTLKDLRMEKRNEEQTKKATAYNMFTWAFSNSNDPILRNAAVKMMNDAGFNLPDDIDLTALTIDDQLRLMDSANNAEAALLYDPSQYTDQESYMVYQQAINAVTGIPGATDVIRESNLRQVQDLLNAGKLDDARDKVRSIASLKLKGEAPEFAARLTIISEAEQLISVLENNPQIRNMYTGKWNDAMAYLAQNQNEDYLAVTSWLGNLTAETIKERYGSAISEGERQEMQRSIPSGKETVQDAITKLKGMIRSNRAKNEVMLDVNMGSISKSTMPSTQQQDFSTEWVIQQMRGERPPVDGGGGSVTIPKENNSIRTGFVNGIVTGYGSKYWDAGVDIAAPKGSPIKSPIGGVVEEVVYNPSWVGTPNNPKVGKSQNGGWGNTVTARYPDGVKLQFAHLSKTAIGKNMVGKPIVPGTTLGYVGNTGNTYGPTGVHVDVTGYRPDGSTMTAEEVTEWMLRNSSTHS